MKIVYFLPALAALLFVAASARAADPTAITADGQTLSAALIAADAQWQLTFSRGGKRQTMPAAELVRWGTFAEPARGPVLVLADGGLLPAEVVKIDKERLTAESDLLGTLKIPLESLSGILFRLPAGRPQRDRLLGRILRPRPRRQRPLAAGQRRRSDRPGRGPGRRHPADHGRRGADRRGRPPHPGRPLRPGGKTAAAAAGFPRLGRTRATAAGCWPASWSSPAARWS